LSYYRSMLKIVPLTLLFLLSSNLHSQIFLDQKKQDPTDTTTKYYLPQYAPAKTTTTTKTPTYTLPASTNTYSFKQQDTLPPSNYIAQQNAMLKLNQFTADRSAKDKEELAQIPLGKEKEMAKNGTWPEVRTAALVYIGKICRANKNACTADYKSILASRISPSNEKDSNTRATAFLYYGIVNDTFATVNWFDDIIKSTNVVYTAAIKAAIIRSIGVMTNTQSEAELESLNDYFATSDFDPSKDSVKVQMAVLESLASKASEMKRYKITDSVPLTYLKELMNSSIGQVGETSKIYSTVLLASIGDKTAQVPLFNIANNSLVTSGVRKIAHDQLKHGHWGDLIPEGSYTDANGGKSGEFLYGVQDKNHFVSYNMIEKEVAFNSAAINTYEFVASWFAFGWLAKGLTSVLSAAAEIPEIAAILGKAEGTVAASEKAIVELTEAEKLAQQTKLAKQAANLADKEAYETEMANRAAQKLADQNKALGLSSDAQAVTTSGETLNPNAFGKGFTEAEQLASNGTQAALIGKTVADAAKADAKVIQLNTTASALKATGTDGQAVSVSALRSSEGAATSDVIKINPTTKALVTDNTGKTILTTTPSGAEAGSWTEKNFSALTSDQKVVLKAALKEATASGVKLDDGLAKAIIDAHKAGGKISATGLEGTQKITKLREISNLKNYLIKDGMSEADAKAFVLKLADKDVKILGDFEGTPREPDVLAKLTTKAITNPSKDLTTDEILSDIQGYKSEAEQGLKETNAGIKKQFTDKGKSVPDEWTGYQEQYKSIIQDCDSKLNDKTFANNAAVAKAQAVQTTASSEAATIQKALTENTTKVNEALAKVSSSPDDAVAAAKARNTLGDVYKSIENSTDTGSVTLKETCKTELVKLDKKIANMDLRDDGGYFKELSLNQGYTKATGDPVIKKMMSDNGFVKDYLKNDAKGTWEYRAQTTDVGHLNKDITTLKTEMKSARDYAKGIKTTATNAKIFDNVDGYYTKIIAEINQTEKEGLAILKARIKELGGTAAK